MLLRRLPLPNAAALLFLVLAVATQAADVPAQNTRLDPQAIIYTFFPVSMLQAFLGVTDAQAAKIRAIETKLYADRLTAKDDSEESSLRRQASDDVRAVLRPDQLETLARCALRLEILTNTFGHDNLERLTLTRKQMPRIQRLLTDAVDRRMVINQERGQEMAAIPEQDTQAARQQRLEEIVQEREQKIRAMRAVVRTGISALLTDKQKAALAAPPATK